MTETHTMNGGDGQYSYAKNSDLQRQATSTVNGTIDEAISEKLDMKALLTNSNTILLADLGCSVGPNTFISIQYVIDAIKRKLESQGITNLITSSSTPEFQVYFNDQAGNDFNALFASLPSERERPYFAAGVPGSFHGRLFPESSLHLVHSSYALQWLSRVPPEILDETSPAYNKGRIHYTGAAEEVYKAYSAQFETDMSLFFDARAQEIVPGGMMVFVMPGVPHGSSPSLPSGALYMSDLLGSCLMDMAKEGLTISEVQVDSFNLPVYLPSPEVISKIVESNGCFNIEKLELSNLVQDIKAKVEGRTLASHLRAGFEGLVSKHFGHHFIDELFERVYKKAEVFLSRLQPSSSQAFQLVVILKRK